MGLAKHTKIVRFVSNCVLVRSQVAGACSERKKEMGLAIIYFWPRSLLEAPKWVKDPGNGLKSIRGSWRDHFGGISGVLDPFRGF